MASVRSTVESVQRRSKLLLACKDGLTTSGSPLNNRLAATRSQQWSLTSHQLCLYIEHHPPADTRSAIDRGLAEVKAGATPNGKEQLVAHDLVVWKRRQLQQVETSAQRTPQVNKTYQVASTRAHAASRQGACQRGLAHVLAVGNAASWAALPTCPRM